jgi:hypothetical protein
VFNNCTICDDDDAMDTSEDIVVRGGPSRPGRDQYYGRWIDDRNIRIASRANPEFHVTFCADHADEYYIAAGNCCDGLETSAFPKSDAGRRKVLGLNSVTPPKESMAGGRCMFIVHKTDNPNKDGVEFRIDCSVHMSTWLELEIGIGG